MTDIKLLFGNIGQYAGKEVTVCGWTRTVRDSKAFGFIELNDGSCFKSVQVVFEREKLKNYDEIAKLNVGSSLIVSGTVVATPENKQPFEIKATEIKVEGKSAPDYPLQKKRHSVEFLREIAHLRPRTNLFNAVMRVRSEAAFALHTFFHERGFVYVHTPIITSSDCEGAGEMFQVTTLDLNDLPKTPAGEADFSKDFFGTNTGLTVSGQLQVEAYAMAFGKVYTFGPTFRAEKSNTQRHAAEFWQIEPEVAFADLNDVMQIAEDMVKFVVRRILATCADEINFFDSFVSAGLKERLEKLAASEFVRMPYTKAIELLAPHNAEFDYPVHWGSDIQTEHERFLTETIVGGPVFVTDYPKEIKSFYMKQNADGKTVAATDMLVPGIGELIGGSQREEDYDKLAARIKELHMNEADYDWYLDLRKYGTATHSGFGIGFERLIMYLTGVSNIRDVLPFPRTVGNIKF